MRDTTCVGDTAAERRRAWCTEHPVRGANRRFLTPGQVLGEVPPPGFASLVALRRRWSFALPTVWLLNAVGTVDLLNALRQAGAVP
jgi:hypothetical protein